MDSMNIDNVKSDRDTFVGSTVTQNIYGAATPVITSLHQLRAPVADFVGRQDEIDHLVQVMCKATESGKVAVGGIRGMGGMGKSELAYAVAQRLADTFPDAQLFLELRGAIGNPMTPEQALQTIIRAFEPGMQLPDNLNALRSIYTPLLTGKRVLILADDALDRRQVEPLLPPPGCALLLTSRYRFSLSGMEMETLDLEILPQPDAEKLLLEISPDIGPAAPRMAQLCGRLPLALRICASMCDSDDSILTIEDHLKALEDERARLAYMKDPNVQDANDPATSVEASLQLSYAALDSQMRQVLCQLSVFPSSFDILAAEAVVQVAGAEWQGTNANSPPMTIERSLEFLYRRNLVNQDKETKRFSLHDLVRVFGLARLESEGDEAVRMRHAQYYVWVVAAANELYMRGGENVLLGLTWFDGERANVDAGWQWAREQTGSASQESAALLLAYANATAYMGDLRYDIRRERIPQLEAMLGAARRLKRRRYEGMALGILGLAYNDLGEPRKAIQYFEPQLEIARQIGDRLGEGNALRSLGMAYKDLGEPRKAIQYFEQCLEIVREVGDQRGEGATLSSLGIAYAKLGKLRKAIQCFEQHLEITRQIGDRLNEGITLGNLGAAHADLGEPRKAIQYFEPQLEIVRQIGDRRGEANSSWNLGLLLSKVGDLARAVELMQVMVDYEREIGHPDTEKDAAKVEELRKSLP
jgi:tetratricopeptide (TPR) repeat protein